MIESLRWVAFIIGLMFGSLTNVLIFRLPQGENWITQRSHCQKCNALIPFYLNIPLVAFIFLRGRCATCGSKISWQYPLVELVVGVYAYLIFPSEFSVLALVRWFLLLLIFTILTAHFIIDLYHHLLLDRLNIALLIMVLCYIFLFSNWKFALWGGGIGFFFPLIVSELFYRLKGVDGLGGGDIKLWGVLGLLLGPGMIVENIFYSSLLGSILGGAFLLITKKNRTHAFAFGPFIIIAYLLQFHFDRFIPSFLKLF